MAGKKGLTYREKKQLREDWSRLVQDFLKRTGLSETETAERIGCDRSLINKWRQGKSIPSEMAKRAFEELCRKEGMLK